MRIYKRHQIQPDETIYSWITRLYILGVFSSEAKFYAENFGTTKIRFHPYLPAHISSIASLTNSNSMDLLNNHTLYSLFRWFGVEKENELKQAMLSESGGEVVQKARLTNVNFSFYLGHKYCSCCVTEDTNRLGFPYFKLFHQIPGVDSCYRHGCLLHGLDCGDFGCDRHLLLPKLNARLMLASDLQVAFSKFTFQALAMAQSDNKFCQYKNVYHSLLNEQKLRTDNGQLLISKIVNNLKNFYPEGSFITKLGLPKNLLSFKFVAPLLRNKTHFPCHPTKHLILANWLFDGDIKSYIPKSNTEPEAHANRSIKISPDNEIIGLLRVGLSMNQIEKYTGKSRCYIRRVAELNNIPHRSNDSAYDTDLRHMVILQAQLGRHRKAISEMLGVGIGYIEQVISNTPGLVSWRKRFKVQVKISAAVKELHAAISQHPSWNRKDIKQHCNQSFFYLYRQARDILEELLPPKLLPHTPRKNWQEEDKRLFDAISLLPDARELSLTAIGYRVKDHAHLRRKLNDLPKTKALLKTFGKNRSK